MPPDITLRPLSLADADSYHRLTGNEAVMAYITGEVYTAAENFEEVQRLTQKFANRHPWGVWVAELTDSGYFVGVGALIPVDNDSGADIGYRVVPEFWGRAYGQAIAYALLAMARHAGLKHLTATVEKENSASVAIIEKLGFWVVSEEWNERQRLEYTYKLEL